MTTKIELRRAAGECLAQLGAAYRVEFGPDAAEAYWLVLGELSAERMRRAVDKAIREEKFCPTPATIRQHARSLNNAGGGTGEPREVKAYTPPTAEQWKEIQAMNARLRKRCLAMAEELKP
jgi:hypothetical protein